MPTLNLENVQKGFKLKESFENIKFRKRYQLAYFRISFNLISFQFSRNVQKLYLTISGYLAKFEPQNLNNKSSDE